MHDLPEYPQRGRPITERWGRAVVDYLRSLTPRGSADIAINHDSAGTSATLKRPQLVAATAADHPWMPYASSAAKFRVIPSAADNIIPSNWDAEFAVTNADGRWVWLACTMAQEGKIASCEIAEGAAVPATDLPAEDGAIPSPIYVPLFAYDAANHAMTKYYSVVTANLSTQIQITEAGCDKVIRSAVIVQ